MRIAGNRCASDVWRAWGDRIARVAIMRRVVVFDASDLTAESSFWAGMLDGRVFADDDFHNVFDAEDRWVMGVQLAPNHVKPDWPDGEPQQIHLDLYVDDVRAAEEKALALGATLLKEAYDVDAGHGFRVYADPSGHPFCLCWDPAPSA